MRVKTTLAILLGAVVLMSGRQAPAAGDDEAGFKPIFDGKTLQGWDGNPDYWRVEDGTITGEITKDKPLKENTFIIWRRGELDDFELKVEYRIVNGNSGVQYRSFEKPAEWGKWVVGGYQADLVSHDKWTGILYGERDRGFLARRGEKTVIGDDHQSKVVGHVGDGDELQTKIRKEDWNAYHIIVRGNHFIHKINGQVMIEADDEDKQMRRRSGILALQLHAGDPGKVQFRNIRLKRLPMEDKKKIVLVAGPRSHGYGEHEQNAACLLFAKALNENVPQVHAVVYRDGWPADPTAFDNADAVMMYCDGADGHVVIPHLAEMDALAKKGMGLACLHYAVEVPKGEAGNRFLDWIGGYFELEWSVNPFWNVEFKELPSHPITRGVKPFSIIDEWYYHMRFRENMDGVTPILTAVPPEKTREGKDGPRSGNKYVRARKGMPEHVAWAYQRPDGGRGFGFTGGHTQWNFGHDDYRKLILNALVWVARAEVPADGVRSKTPSLEELEANQDDPAPKKFNREAIRKQLQQWSTTTTPTK